jgi:uncharacterized membrane protein YeaQ/YmgE (transglycosylase-associated protein family)
MKRGGEELDAIPETQGAKTFLGRAVGHHEPGQSAGFLMALVGALILLGIYHLIKRSQTRT